MRPVAEQTVLVTGATDGLGKAVAVTPVPASSSARSKVNMICASLLWQ